MSLVSELVALREAKGLSQLRLARLLGVSQSYVCKLEHRHESELRIGEIRAYLQVLGKQLAIAIR